MPDATLEMRERLAAFVGARVPEADVDDVVQEIYLRLARGTDHVEHVSGFAHQVARSVVADFHRTRSRHEKLVEAAQDQELEPLEPEGAGAVVASWLGPIIDDLEEPYASTLRRVELEGQSHDELARELGAPRSTVTSRVKKGRELLRKKLTRCCAIALDARGGVMDWTPRAKSDCCE